MPHPIDYRDWWQRHANQPPPLSPTGHPARRFQFQSGPALRGEPLRFRTGGVVPGPPGKPVMAVVHGGEKIVPAGKPKIRRVMGEFKRKKLRSSSGALVKKRAQALATAMSEARRAHGM